MFGFKRKNNKDRSEVSSENNNGDSGFFTNTADDIPQDIPVGIGDDKENPEDSTVDSQDVEIDVVDEDVQDSAEESKDTDPEDSKSRSWFPSLYDDSGKPVNVSKTEGIYQDHVADDADTADVDDANTADADTADVDDANTVDADIADVDDVDTAETDDADTAETDDADTAETNDDADTADAEDADTVETDDADTAETDDANTADTADDEQGESAEEIDAEIEDLTDEETEMLESILDEGYDDDYTDYQKLADDEYDQEKYKKIFPEDQEVKPIVDESSDDSSVGEDNLDTEALTDYDEDELIPLDELEKTIRDEESATQDDAMSPALDAVKANPVQPEPIYAVGENIKEMLEDYLNDTRVFLIDLTKENDGFTRFIPKGAVPSFISLPDTVQVSYLDARKIITHAASLEGPSYIVVTGADELLDSLDDRFPEGSVGYSLIVENCHNALREALQYPNIGVVVASTKRSDRLDGIIESSDVDFENISG